MSLRFRNRQQAAPPEAGADPRISIGSAGVTSDVIYRPMRKVGDVPAIHRQLVAGYLKTGEVGTDVLAASIGAMTLAVENKDYAEIIVICNELIDNSIESRNQH